jgi:hypothetical protein
MSVVAKRAPPRRGLSYGILVGTMLAAIAGQGAAVAQSCAEQCSLATLSRPIAASAGDLTNSTAKMVPRKRLPPSTPQRPVQQSESTPRWTISVEAIVLGRMGGVNQTLVSRVPGTVPYYDPPNPDSFSDPGVQAFNSNQFWQGFSAGPKIALTYHGGSGYGAELSYFNIFDQRATEAIGPDSPADWLVMKAPGAFWQTQDFPYQAMVWSSATNLYSAEANGRLDLSSRVTILAGVRWLQLNDNLQGTLTPADRNEPSWKQGCLFSNSPNCYIANVSSNVPPEIYPPFWTTSTTNNLYGVQIGLDGKIWELGRFSLGGTIKVGVFDNNAEQSTGVSLEKTVYPATAATNHAAFASEASLQVKYQLTKGLALKAGYEALWLDGVALAPGQIQQTYTALSTPPNVRALGVNCGSNVLFQGATAGLEYSF